MCIIHFQRYINGVQLAESCYTMLIKLKSHRSALLHHLEVIEQSITDVEACIISNSCLPHIHMHRQTTAAPLTSPSSTPATISEVVHLTTPETQASLKRKLCSHISVPYAHPFNPP